MRTMALKSQDMNKEYQSLTPMKTQYPNSILTMYTLGPEKIKQLQQQDKHKTKIIDKCNSKKNEKHPII